MCLCSRIYHDEDVEPNTINNFLSLLQRRALHDKTLVSELGFTINEKQQRRDNSNESVSRGLWKEGENRDDDLDCGNECPDSESREDESPALERQEEELLEEEQVLEEERALEEEQVLEEDEEEEEGDGRERENENPNSNTKKEEDRVLCSDPAVRKWRLPQAVIDILRVKGSAWLENASSFWNDGADESSFSQPLTDVFFALKTISDQNAVNNLKGVLLTLLLYRLRQECPYLDSKTIAGQIQEAGYYSNLSSQQLQKDYERFYIIGRRHNVFAQSLNGIGAIPLLYDENVPRSTWESRLRLTGDPFNQAIVFLKMKGILIGQQYNLLLEHLLDYRKRAIWFQWQQANVGVYQEPPQSYRRPSTCRKNFVPITGKKRQKEDTSSLQIVKKRLKTVGQLDPRPISAVLPEASINTRIERQRVFRVCDADAQAETISSASATVSSETHDQAPNRNQVMAVSRDQGLKHTDSHGTTTVELTNNLEIMVPGNIPAAVDPLEIFGLGARGSCAPVLNHNLDHFGGFGPNPIADAYGHLASSAFDGREDNIFASVVPVLNHGLEPFSNIDITLPTLNSGLDYFKFASTSPFLNRGLDCFNSIDDSDASLQQHLSLVFAGVESGDDFGQSQEPQTPVLTMYASHAQDLYTGAAMIAEGQQGNEIPQAETDSSALPSHQQTAQLCW